MLGLKKSVVLAFFGIDLVLLLEKQIRERKKNLTLLTKHGMRPENSTTTRPAP